MDKNQLIGWVLIAGIILGFFALNKEEPQAIVDNQEKKSIDKVNSNQLSNLEEQEIPLKQIGSKTNLSEKDSIELKKANDELIFKYGIFSESAEKPNQDYIIENNKIKLHINSNGAFVSKAILKDFKSYEDYKNNENGELVLFQGLGNEQNIKFRHKGLPQNTNQFKFVPDVNSLNVIEGKESISFKLEASTGGYILYTYTLKANDYLVDFNISFSGLEQMIEPLDDGLQLNWKQKPGSVEKSIKIERQGSSVFWHSKEDGYDYLSEQSEEDKETAEFATDWISFKQQFFSTILIVKGKELTYPTMSIHYDDEDSSYLKEYTASSPLKFNTLTANNFEFQWYFAI